MQVRSKLDHIFALLVLLVGSFSVCIACPANEGDFRVFSRFRAAHSEKQRLRAFISAVDRRLVFPGMKVVDLDKLLGTKFCGQIPVTESSVQHAEYKFGERDNSWRLVVVINRKGEVCGYCLSRFFLKPDSYSEEPNVNIAQIENKFSKAKTPSQKLACAIQAFESRVIKCGVKRSTLVTIFGNSTEDRAVKSIHGYPSRDLDIVSSFVFGASKNSWRLITSGSSEDIYDSILKNYDCDNSNEYSEVRWPLIEGALKK